MSVNPPAANNQGVPSEAEIKKAEKETTKEDVANVRTVGWENEQARREKEVEENGSLPAPARVEKFKGHKLEDRLEVKPESQE